MDKLCILPGGEARVTWWRVITLDMAGAGSALLPAQAGPAPDSRQGSLFHDTVCFVSLLPAEPLPGAHSLPPLPFLSSLMSSQTKTMEMPHLPRRPGSSLLT